MLTLAFLLVTQSGSSPAASIADLTKNVGVLPTGGIPGPVAVLGPNAFPVIQSGDGKVNYAMAAATPFGKGRVLASTKIEIGGTDKESKTFTMNVLRWLSPNKLPKKIGTYGLDGPARNLKDMGFETTALKSGSKWDDYDVVLIDGHQLQPGDVEPLRTYVQNGGGISVTGLAWGWAQITGKSIRDDAVYNKLLVPMGLALSDGYIDGALAPSDPKNVSWDKLNATRIAMRLESAGSQPIPAAEAKQMSQILTNCLGAVPATDPLFIRLKNLTEKSPAVIPTEANPLKAANILGRAGVIIRDAGYRTSPAASLKADPAAATFPGLLPVGAKRETVTTSLDLTGGQWVSTGLYINAGELSTITHPEIRGLRFQIGCHSDENWHHDSWTRFPSILYSYPATGTETKVASPFGGLVYVQAPRNSGPNHSITFSNVARSPRYVLGQTTDAEWKQMVEQAPGPWAEFEGTRLILTVPSQAARKVQDPKKLMELWEKIMDCYVELGTRPINHKERIVTDMQISAGYMHSGYPIMTWMDVQDLVVSYEKLTTEGSWGHWHELGHNHQQGAWTFDGTGEVTCNLFSLYVYEKVIGREVGDARVREVEPRFRRHIEAGAPYDKWKDDPFLALYMYYQLRDEFGWDTYKKVLADYRDAPRNDLPRNDQEKRDQWMVRFSKAAGRNLGPFFQAWGVPTTQGARDSIKDLPVWMPPNFPKNPKL